MSLRHLPDFLKQGDKDLAMPRPKPEARLRGMIGTALPDLPPPGDWGSHDAASAQERAAVEWLRHLRAGRIG
jgi:hypothetical protein